MARLSTRLCCAPTCKEIGVGVAGGWLCEPHRKQRRAPRRAGPDRGYGKRAWRNARDRYLREHPRCELCGAVATEVHHRDHRSPDQPGANDWRNLQALCHSDHRRLTVEHYRAKGGG